MFKSRMGSVRVAQIAGLPDATTPAPSTIVDQARVDCVVRVRNNGYGQYVLLAADAAVLQTFPASGDVWQLPAGAVDVFVLAAGQSLLAATPFAGVDGEGVLISYHIYESLPVVAGDGGGAA